MSIKSPVNTSSEFRLYYADYAVIFAILTAGAIAYFLMSIPSFNERVAGDTGPSIYLSYTIIALNITGCVFAVVSMVTRERNTYNKYIGAVLNFFLIITLLLFLYWANGWD